MVNLRPNVQNGKRGKNVIQPVEADGASNGVTKKNHLDEYKTKKETSVCFYFKKISKQQLFT
jgi:hypothetical protein